MTLDATISFAENCSLFGCFCGISNALLFEIRSARKLCSMTSRYLVPLLCLSSLSAQTGSDALKTIANYCSGCHDGRVQPSGVRLLSYDATQIAAQPEIWAKAYRQIQADAMPPAGARRPTRAESKAVLVSIEEALGAHAKPTIADSQTIATRLATLL